MSVIRWKFEDYWATRDRTSTFLYTGSPQFFVVPDGVEQLEVWARGAYGGGLISDGIYLGGYLHGMLPCTPGETLQMNVGGIGGHHDVYHAGLGGWNGGGRGGASTQSTKNGGDGGGGATDIRRGSTLADRLIVAAGAAGNSGQGYRGGAGGPSGNTAYGTHGTTTGLGGRGATPLAPGAGGTNGGNPGSLGTGGAGTGSVGHGAGGGGGGEYGGGGGGKTSDSAYSYGGGGGSNDVDGFDATQPIRNEKGILAVSLGELRQPSLQVLYAMQPSSYVFDINPNDGGTPNVAKSIVASTSTGPNRNPILQEGASSAPTMPFSGSILTQEHLEALETWFDRRVFLKLTDDLGREFYGVFSRFDAHRVRRGSNFWYHTFDAEFTLGAYRNASGQWVYGRVS